MTTRASITSRSRVVDRGSSTEDPREGTARDDADRYRPAQKHPHGDGRRAADEPGGGVDPDRRDADRVPPHADLGQAVAAATPGRGERRGTRAASDVVVAGARRGGRRRAHHSDSPGPAAVSWRGPQERPDRRQRSRLLRRIARRRASAARRRHGRRNGRSRRTAGQPQPVPGAGGEPAPRAASGLDRRWRTSRPVRYRRLRPAAHGPTQRSGRAGPQVRRDGPGGRDADSRTS